MDATDFVREAEGSLNLPHEVQFKIWAQLRQGVVNLTIKVGFFFSSENRSLVIQVVLLDTELFWHVVEYNPISNPTMFGERILSKLNSGY